MSSEESFTSLQLPANAIAALYPEVIVLNDTKAAAAAVKATETPAPAPAPTPAPPPPAAKASPKKKEAVAKDLPAPAEGPAFKWLGENLSAVTLVVHYPEEAFVPDEQLSFITRILGACKLNLGDVALVNTGRSNVSIQQIKEVLKPSKLILFGVNPDQLGLPIRFPEFKLQAYDGTTYLLVPTAEPMNQDTEEGKVLKSKFWVCLRSLFNV